MTPLTTPPAIRVMVNDRTLAVASVEERGHVLVPMRAIFEALGADVRYDARTHTVDAQANGRRIHLRVGGRNAPIIADRTYVPLRFVSTALGAHVGYDGRERIVSVTTPQFEAAPVAQRTPSVTFYERPTPVPPPPTTLNGLPYEAQSSLQLSVSGRWFEPGEPINVQLTAPPGGEAFVFLCTSSWRYQMFGTANSPYYYATLYAPRNEQLPSCPITAMYVAWNGNVSYSPYPVFVQFAGPTIMGTPQPTPRPTPTPTPVVTPPPRTTIPDRRIPEPAPRERVSPPPSGVP